MTEETKQNYSAMVDNAVKIITLVSPVLGLAALGWINGKFATASAQQHEAFVEYVEEYYIHKNDSVFFYDKRKDNLATTKELSEFIKKSNADISAHNDPNTHFSKSEVVGIYEYQKDGYEDQKQIDVLDNRLKNVEEEIHEH